MSTPAYIQTIIDSAEAYAKDTFVSPVTKASISMARADLDAALTIASDYVEYMSRCHLDMVHAFETGAPLETHKFADEHYSKVTTSVRISHLRSAYRELREAVDQASEDVRKHLALRMAV
jgi:hypothetical protein